MKMAQLVADLDDAHLEFAEPLNPALGQFKLVVPMDADPCGGQGGALLLLRSQIDTFEAG
jgi:hypothetical protein